MLPAHPRSAVTIIVGPGTGCSLLLSWIVVITSQLASLLLVYPLLFFAFPGEKPLCLASTTPHQLSWLLYGPCLHFHPRFPLLVPSSWALASGTTCSVDDEVLSRHIPRLCSPPRPLPPGLSTSPVHPVLPSGLNCHVFLRKPFQTQPLLTTLLPTGEQPNVMCG